ncbi:MAG: substrate-binding domain-containing protein [Opitutaceae bacterium]|jgi:DNA-binding LacI/PurR family transcriptional regulator|nr:substrate-binding domain-containing protein [Opitutaceae bacterium]
MLASLVAYRRGKSGVSIRSCIGWINMWEDPKALRRFKEFDGYWLGAKDAAERLGYNLEEFRWQRGKSGARLQSILETRGVRGLLIPPHGGELQLPDFDWNRFSLVRFGSSVTNLPAHTVTSDQSHCARLACQKAFAYGYKRVGYVTDDAFERSTGGHFREGYLNAQEEFAVPGDRLNTLVLEPDARRNQAQFTKWLAREKPQAIFTTSPRLLGIMNGLGLRVPDDLAVATTSVLDGNFDAGADQNSPEIGRVAVSTLAALVLENERGIPQYQRRILVEGRWVDGKSLPRRVATTA